MTYGFVGRILASALGARRKGANQRPLTANQRIRDGQRRRGRGRRRRRKRRRRRGREEGRTAVAGSVFVWCLLLEKNKKIKNT